MDNQWYRAKVLKSLGKGQFEVEFIDFGNVETVTYEDMRRLNQALLSYEPQAKPSQLAFIKVQRGGNEVGDETIKVISDMALDKTVDAIITGDENEMLQVVLLPKGEQNWNKSLNCRLIEKGLAMMKKYDEDDETLPEEINEWYDFEEEAKEQQIKIWQYGNNADDDSD